MARDCVNLNMKPTATVVIIAIALLSIYIQWPQPKLDVDFYSNLAAEYIGSDISDINNANVIPLKDVTIVITGATSGLGFALTCRLHELGGTIIAIGRSPSKLDRLREKLDGTSLSEDNKVLSTQRLFPIIADFEDLGAVSAAADIISSRFRRIDFLINNAGIHYFPAGKRTSSQGYDIVFGGKIFRMHNHQFINSSVSNISHSHFLLVPSKPGISCPCKK